MPEQLPSIPPSVPVAAAQGALAGGGAGAPAKPRRKPQHCVECGHKMRIGVLKKYHPQFLSAAQPKKCTVPERLHRLAVRPTQQNALRKFGGECECTGDAAHLGGCKLDSLL